MLPNSSSASDATFGPRACLPLAAAVVGLMWLATCSTETDEPTAPRWTAQQRGWVEAMTPMLALPKSPGNKWANDDKAARLGHRLFFEAGFSPDGKTACATCHQPKLFFSDGLPVSKGAGTPWRHTPNLIAAAHSPWQGWDGACDSLWCMALVALEHPERMGSSRLKVIHTIKSQHELDWVGVFGKLPDLSDSKRFPATGQPAAAVDQETINVLFANAGKALGAYMRNILPAEAPVDRYVAAIKGGDESGGGHFGAAEERGLDLYVGKAGCIACHFGPRFTNDAFYNVASLDGIAQTGTDHGRAKGILAALDSAWSCLGDYSDAKSGECVHLLFANPKEFHAIGAFKVSSLRNAQETAPFMHGGQCKDLRESVEHYNRIDLFAPPYGITEPYLTSLNLSKVEKADLEAFLRSLSGPVPDAWWAKPPVEPAP